MAEPTAYPAKGIVPISDSNPLRISGHKRGAALLNLDEQPAVGPARSAAVDGPPTL